MAEVRNAAQPELVASNGSSIAPSSRLLNLFPVVVSLILSTAFIIRSATTLNGRRAYLLFDDATISLTYARNLATGHGLVWNAGQHAVEGYSNFLWTLWMAVLELTHPSDRLAGLGVMISGAVLLAANVYVVTRIARRLAPGSRLVPLLSGLAVALYYGLASWTLVGMETGLVALLYSTALLCALKACGATTATRNSHRLFLGCGLLLALAVLTRDDTLVVAFVIMAFIYLRSRPRIVALSLTGVPVLLAFVGHLVFRIAYYGLPLPNTYYLKVQGIPLANRVGRGLVVLGQNATMQLVVPVALTAAFLWLATRHGRNPPVGSGLLLGVIAAQAVYVVYVGGDSYDSSYSDRFLASIAPFLFILAVLGGIELARAARPSPRPIAGMGVLFLAAGTFVASTLLPTNLIQLPTGPAWRFTSWTAILVVAGIAVIALGVIPVFRRMSMSVTVCGLVLVAILATNWIPLANWYQHDWIYSGLDQFPAREGVALAKSTPVTATVAVGGAGNVAFFDHRTSIDTLGYSDHFIATRKPHLFISRPGHDKWDFAYSIGKLRPDVVAGLSYPTTSNLRDMTKWGYRSFDAGYFGTVYYQPGWFNPSRFVRGLLPT